ncbi:MAG: hypothetical protein PVI23_06460 [Maricaulaceae bacterium]|jgi:hypothetical protein
MRLLLLCLAAGVLVAGCGRLTPPPGGFVGARAAEMNADFDVTTRDWRAWEDRMPPGPPSFHVTGAVMLPHGGYDVTLTPTTPQGFNPAILMLDLNVTERDGPHTPAVETRGARYDIDPYDAGSPRYDEVNIFYEGEMIARVEVQTTY